MKTTLFINVVFLVLLLPSYGRAQYITITGYVSDERRGVFIENVNIYESSSTIGTLTDKNGFYHIMLPPGTIKLSATFDGFKDFSKQLTLKKDTVLSIQLRPVPDSKSLAKKENEMQASRNPVNDRK